MKQLISYLYHKRSIYFLSLKLKVVQIISDYGCVCIFTLLIEENDLNEYDRIVLGK